MKRISFLVGATVLVAILGLVLLGNSNSNTNQQMPINSSQQGTTLNFSNRGLTKFPKEALNQTSATVLNLSHNNLTGALPAEIKKLTSLQTLDVSYNNMTGIPAEIGQMHSLKIINYSYNNITGLPLELGNLTGLQVLDLRGNNVSQQDLSQIQLKLTNTDIKL